MIAQSKNTEADAHTEFIIMMFLVIFQIVVHHLINRIQDDLVEEMKAIMLAVLEEVTGLGFVAVVGFAIIETGFLQMISLLAFPGDGDHVLHIFEGLHFLLFSIMVTYLASVMFVVYQYKTYAQNLHETEVLVTWKSGIPVLHRAWMLRNNSAACGKGFDKKRFYFALRYLKLRERFIMTRLIDPDTWFADEMHEDFDFSEYMCCNLASLIESLIHIPMSSLRIVMALFVLRYCAQLLNASGAQYALFYLAGGPVVLTLCVLLERNLEWILRQLTPVIPIKLQKEEKPEKQNPFGSADEEEELTQAKKFNDMVTDPPYTDDVDQADCFELANAHGSLFYSKRPELYLSATRVLMLASACFSALIMLKFGILFEIFPIIPFAALLPHLLVMGWYPFRLMNLLMMTSNLEASKNPRSVRKTIHIMKTKKIIRLLQLLDSLAFVHKSVKKKRKMTVQVDKTEASKMAEKFSVMYDKSSSSSEDDEEDDLDRPPRPSRADRIIEQTGGFNPRRGSIANAIDRQAAALEANKLGAAESINTARSHNSHVFEEETDGKERGGEGGEKEALKSPSHEEESATSTTRRAITTKASEHVGEMGLSAGQRVKAEKGVVKAATAFLKMKTIQKKEPKDPTGPKIVAFPAQQLNSPRKTLSHNAGVQRVGLLQRIVGGEEKQQQATQAKLLRMGTMAMGSQPKIMAQGSTTNLSAKLIKVGTLRSLAQQEGRDWFDKAIAGGLEEVREKTFKDAFLLFDTDDSGQIDPEEMHAVMNDLGFHWTMSDIEMCFQEYDKDGDRTIEFGEFREILLCREKDMEAHHPSADSVIRGLFSIFDTDNSGEVTIREFHKVMSKLDPGLAENEVLEFIREIDLNGDGVIDLFEFASMLRKYWVVSSNVQLTHHDMARFKERMGYSGAKTGIQQLRRLSRASEAPQGIAGGKSQSVARASTSVSRASMVGGGAPRGKSGVLGGLLAATSPRKSGADNANPSPRRSNTQASPRRSARRDPDASKATFPTTNDPADGATPRSIVKSATPRGATSRKTTVQLSMQMPNEGSGPETGKLLPSLPLQQVRATLLASPGTYEATDQPRAGSPDPDPDEPDAPRKKHHHHHHKIKTNQIVPMSLAPLPLAGIPLGDDDALD